MNDPLERYRKAWIQEQADRQRQFQAEEDAHQAVWRQRATDFIAEHNLADLLMEFRYGDPEFPSSGWDIVFPLRIPYDGAHLTGSFCLFSEGERVAGAIECDGYDKLYLPATDAEIGRWLVGLEKHKFVPLVDLLC